VFWSLAYRSTPTEDVVIVPYRRGVQGAQYGPDQSESTLLIDATQKHPMAPLALPTREYMEGARAIWEELKLPALSAAATWHGYTLGDWTNTWERFARRAAAGEWEQNGIETLARQRSDVTPEMPTRKMEKAGLKIGVNAAMRILRFGYCDSAMQVRRCRYGGHSFQNRLI
jgi:4-hydroxy-3-polyprenylbenzoate decarboxylase